MKSYIFYISEKIVDGFLSPQRDLPPEALAIRDLPNCKSCYPNTKGYERIPHWICADKVHYELMDMFGEESFERIEIYSCFKVTITKEQVINVFKEQNAIRKRYSEIVELVYNHGATLNDRFLPDEVKKVLKREDYGVIRSYHDMNEGYGGNVYYLFDKAQFFNKRELLNFLYSQLKSSDDDYEFYIYYTVEGMYEYY